MNNLILGRYFPGDSWIHHLDPRAKLLACIYFIAVLFLANNWQTYVLLWFFTLLVMYLIRCPFSHLPDRCSTLNLVDPIYGLFTSIIHIRGNRLFRMGSNHDHRVWFNEWHFSFSVVLS